MSEKPPVQTDQIYAGEHDRDQRGNKKQVNLALHAIIDQLDSLARLLFAFVVGHQQSRDRCAESCNSWLERTADLRPRRRLFALGCKGKSTIGRNPELRQRVLQVLPLLGSTMRH